jgi:hypothetical protein
MTLKQEQIQYLIDHVIGEIVSILQDHQEICGYSYQPKYVNYLDDTIFYLQDMMSILEDKISIIKHLQSQYISVIE